MVFFPGHFTLAQSVLASKEISKRLSSSKTRVFWKREKNMRLRWENKTKYILRTLCIFPQGKNDEICHDLWSTPLTWAVSLIKEIGPNGEANHMIIPKVNNVTHPLFLLSNFPQGPQGHASIAHEVQGSPGWAKGSRWKYFAGVLQKREVSSLHQLILHWIFQVLKWALFLWTFFAIFFSQHTLHHTEWKLPIFHTLFWNFPGSTVYNANQSFLRNFSNAACQIDCTPCVAFHDHHSWRSLQWQRSPWYQLGRGGLDYKTSITVNFRPSS